MKVRKKGRFLAANSSQKKKHSFRSPKYSKTTGVVDLGYFEENMDAGALFFHEIGYAAATNAVNENKAMQIPTTFLQDGWIVRRMPNGIIEKVYQVNAGNGTSKNRKLTKGSILHVKKAIR